MYLDLARELKKLWNMKMTVVPIVIGALGKIPKDEPRPSKLQHCWDLPEYWREFGWLEGTPVKDHQLIFVWKTCKESNNNEIVNHIISKFGKLAQKVYKVSHIKVGRVIHWELSKTVKTRPFWQMVYALSIICHRKWNAYKHGNLKYNLIPTRIQDLVWNYK